MATINSLIAKARNLLAICNGFTGGSAKDITSAVNSVISTAEGKITPEGNVNINDNGVVDVTIYAQATVNVEKGTNVSDTTATASDVVSGKTFYNSSGTKTNGSLSIASVTPSNSAPAYVTSDKNYKPSANGYVISSYETLDPSFITRQEELAAGMYSVTSKVYAIPNYSSNWLVPSTAGKSFSSGWNYLTAGGYAYSEKPSSGATNTISVSSYTSNATITINTGLSTINFFTFLYYEDASTGRVSYCVFSKDFNESYCVSAYRSSGGSASGYIAISSSRQAYMYTVNSVSGGTIVINVPTNANYKQSSIGHAKWMAV